MAHNLKINGPLTRDLVIKSRNLIKALDHTGIFELTTQTILPLFSTTWGCGIKAYFMLHKIC